MMQPKRTKHRTQMKQVRHLRGRETRGCEIEFGDMALQAEEDGWWTDRQIEASRVAIARSVKRGGKLFIRPFPDKPLTKKPAEVRMGSGKGGTELWVAEIRKGRILFEIAGVEDKLAVKALTLAASKLPFSCRIIRRSAGLI